MNQMTNDVKLMEIILQKQMEIEVRKYITDVIQPQVDSIVKEVAAEAVKNWSNNIRTEKTMVDTFDQQTRIQINFVENVVRTQIVKDNIEITVNKGKKDVK